MRNEVLVLLFAFLLGGTVFGGEGGDLLPYKVVSMKMEGKYWRGQFLKGTMKGIDERSDKIVERTGWQEVPSFNFHNDPSTLNDGKLGWGDGLHSYCWSSHEKRITVVMELQRDAEVSHLEVWQFPHASTLIRDIEVYPALMKDKSGAFLFESPVRAGQTELRGKSAYPIDVGVHKTCRRLKVVCSNYKPLSLVIPEIKVFGKAAGGQAGKPSVPGSTYRVEMESIMGPWKTDSSHALGGHGIWIDESERPHFIEVRNPGDAKAPMFFWIRYQGSPLLVALDGVRMLLPRQGVKWTRCGSTAAEVISFHLEPGMDSRADSRVTWVDSLLFTGDRDFDPNRIDALVLDRIVPEVKPVPKFSQRLLRDDPGISPEDFAGRMLAHYGINHRRPGRVVDENNCILVDGKPFFPMLCYGLDPEKPEFKETALNIGHWCGRGWRNEGFAKYCIGGRERFAFDRQVFDSFCQDSRNVGFIHLYDEPDNHPEFTFHHFRLLNALMKALFPNTVTSVNFGANSNSREAFKVSDILSLDHYPVSSGQISDIGYSVDYMRYYGENRPLLFIGQIFKWDSPAQRFPTSDEISAMTILSLVHGVKGLQWYQWSRKNPGGPKSKGYVYLSPVDFPEQWRRFCRMTQAIDRIKEGLLGPEVKRVFRPGRGCPAEFRVVVSADRGRAWLIAVNPTPKEVRAGIDFSGGVLAGLKLSPHTDFGCRLVEARDSGFVFAMRPFGSGFFELRSPSLRLLERITTPELLAMLRDRFESKVTEQSAAAVVQRGRKPDWSKAVDLGATWRSLLRPDKAQILLNDYGVHLDMAIRYQIGKKSVVVKRDGPVWQDVAMEIFLGIPGREKYAHLMVNTLNVQAEDVIEIHPDGSKRTERDSVYEWESRASCTAETAHFQVSIPWGTMEKMIGVTKGRSFTLNLCSQRRDWVGLTGSGYHVPMRFGLIKVTP